MTFTDFLLSYWEKFDSLTIVILLIVLICIIVIYIVARPKKIPVSAENLKYEFITIIAHKFRTPLTQIKWSIDELLTKEDDSFKIQNLKDMQGSNEKLIKLTGTLVELIESEASADVSYSFETTSLCDFVRNISATFKDLFHEKNLFFSVACPPYDVTAEIDKARMEFVLQVLFENAAMYSSPGRNVEVSIDRKDQVAIVSVTDHGVGINKVDIDNVFTKFFRAKDAQSADTEGLGVGLYLAQSVVSKHKGTIEVFSEGTGKGSTFILKIPITRK